MTNRLAGEKSPYLRQHAENPVDWYPWGEEAFKAARAQDKPIFLSIGYSTCHWCHVMARESFQNPEIAELLNEAFINIKVDREERPDVDSLYMDFAQALLSTGSGWPLNVILTPDLKPFFAVTYIAPAAHRGLIGFPDLIHQIQQAWQGSDKEELIKQAGQLVEMFAQTSNATGHELPSEHEVEKGASKCLEFADPLNGGLRGDPKFPLSYQLEFLLGHSKKTGDERSLYYTELTLNMMAAGGIYDQIGGGFSRYSIDENWIIPHFEKMVYDNALLAKTYIEAYKFTKKEKYAQICRDILDYLLREMRHDAGSFYSAQDAETEGVEGLFYTWTPEEIHEVLPGEEGEICCTYYDVTHQGNFDGRTVLHLESSLEEFAASMNLDLKQFRALTQKWKKALFAKREMRQKPFKDTKVLTAWNALVIEALTLAGSALQEARYLEAAKEACGFIEKHLWKEGRLLHCFCDGEARFDANLSDHAFLIQALLTLYQHTAEISYFNWAITLTKIVCRDFKEIEGAFYQTDERDQLLLRKCEFYDGAEPSGNAVHTENLLRLYQMTAEDSYLEQAEDVLKASKRYIDLFAPGACYHLLALERYFDLKAPTLIIALNEKREHEAEIKKTLFTRFCPHAEVLWRFVGGKGLEEDKIPIGGNTTLYLCLQNKCEPPLTKLDEIVKAIEKL